MNEERVCYLIRDMKNGAKNMYISSVVGENDNSEADPVTALHRARIIQESVEIDVYAYENGVV